MKGRHSSSETDRRWAPNARLAALGVAPIAAAVLAVGAGGTGLALGRADLAAAGAVTGAGGVLLEQIASRRTRRRLRRDRSDLRRRILELESAVSALKRERDASPAMLFPQPPPAPITGPLPIVSAEHRAAGPITPRSLPILTANRRGLQSSAPAEAAAVLASGLLPGQRPPATPITGLSLPPVEDPGLPKLEPGPAAPMLHTGSVPRLDPGPSQSVDRGHRDGSRDSGDFALIGAALIVERATRRPEPAAAVLDLRTAAADTPRTTTMSRTSPVRVDDMVLASMTESDRGEFEVFLEQPARRAASLFEPSGRHVAERATGEPFHVDEVQMRRLADAARHASRQMRSSGRHLPASPYFTPGAFDGEAQAQRDSA